MKHYGPAVAEGSEVINLTAPSGLEFPDNINVGELFFKTDENKLYMYGNDNWTDIVTGDSGGGGTTYDAGTGISIGNIGSPAVPTISIDQTFSPTWTGRHIFSRTDSPRVIDFESSASNGPYVTWTRSATPFADFGSDAQVFASGTVDGFGIATRGAHPISLGVAGSRMWTATGDVSTIIYGNDSDVPLHTFHGNIETNGGTTSTISLTTSGDTGGEGSFDIQQWSDGVAYLWNNRDTALLIGTNNTTRLTVSGAGAVRFNSYGAGLLTTDSSGNITAGTSGAALTDVVHTSGNESISGIKTFSSAPTVGVSGVNSGYNGVRFYDGGALDASFIVEDTTTTPSSGVYNSTAPGWVWQWDGGTLAVGTVPVANISGLANSATITAATSATASTIAQRDGSGYLFASYFNQSSSASENPTISQVIVTNSGDGYFRKASISHLAGSLPTVTSAYRAMARSHPSDYWIGMDWDGSTYWELQGINTSNGVHAGCRVDYADFAAATRNISNKAGTTKTLSDSGPSGGSDGDIWYEY